MSSVPAQWKGRYLLTCNYLQQGCQSPFHQEPHQPHSCLQRAEIILGLYKCNYSLTIKKLKLHSALWRQLQGWYDPRWTWVWLPWYGIFVLCENSHYIAYGTTTKASESMFTSGYWLRIILRQEQALFLEFLRFIHLVVKHSTDVFQMNKCLKPRHPIGCVGLDIAQFSSCVWTFVLVLNF